MDAVLSSIQTRGDGIEVNDKARRHYGEQNLIAEGYEALLQLQLIAVKNSNGAFEATLISKLAENIMVVQKAKQIRQ